MKEDFEIKPEGTLIGRAIELDSIYSSLLFRLLTFFFWVIGSFSIALLLGHYILNQNYNQRLVGLAFFIFAFFIFYIIYRSFYFKKIRLPGSIPLKKILTEDPKNLNLFSYFSFNLAKVTRGIFLEGKTVTTAELGKAILQSKDVNFMLTKIGLGRESLADAFEGYSGISEVGLIVKTALKIAEELNHTQIEVVDMFTALCQTDPFFSRLISEMGLTVDDVKHLNYWHSTLKERIEEREKIFSPTRFRLTGGIGRDWAFGWTPLLKQFSVDITENIEKNTIEYIGHDHEINQIKEALLRQTGGNAILVGEAGIGKRTAVMGFVKKMAEGKTNSNLDFKRVIKIDIDYLMSGIANPSEITERINNVFWEAASAGNVIIYIENFQNLLSSGDAGKIDATEVLLPILDQGGINIIATSDIANYNQYILSNSALSQRLTRVSIEEPNHEELIRILEDTTPLIEYNSKCFITYEAIKEVISAADKYILNIPNPEKSINLLDATAVKASSARGKTIVMAKDVLEYVTEKYQIPLGEIEENEKKKLLTLENELHNSVIGQNEAISAIANAMRRARAGVMDGKKPIGSFLFLGPTGVGKTESAKALARSYFGDEERMVRFDMSEYKNREDIYRLIGSGNSGVGENLGSLTTALREKPFTLVLFDEVEKASTDILDLFLQILDEGSITDGDGRKVSFRNSIIICTSNAGNNLIREAIKGGSNYRSIKKHLLDYLQEQNIFRPEFLNRFTSVVAFSPLTQDEIARVAFLRMKSLTDRLFQEKGITVMITPEALSILSKMGYDPQMGARPMERMIQEKIESLLAKKILSGELKKGDSLTIVADDIL